MYLSFFNLTPIFYYCYSTGFFIIVNVLLASTGEFGSVLSMISSWIALVGIARWAGLAVYESIFGLMA